MTSVILEKENIIEYKLYTIIKHWLYYSFDVIDGPQFIKLYSQLVDIIKTKGNRTLERF